MNQRGPSIQMVMPWTTAVKWLVIVNVAIWFGVQVLLEQYVTGPLFTRYLSLIPVDVIEHFFIWQPFTYMFVHHPQAMMHIVFNMLTLWLTGAELEARWGTKFFTLYYFVCGVGAAAIYLIAVTIYTLLSGNAVQWQVPVLGASGAIFGLLLAYGIIFGERVVYFMMIFPMKARYLVMILGGVSIVSMLNDGFSAGGVAHLAHLGGLVSGFAFLRFWTWYLQRQWKRKQAPRSGRRLKLVVNNDRKDEDDGNNGGPRYWN